MSQFSTARTSLTSLDVAPVPQLQNDLQLHMKRARSEDIPGDGGQQKRSRIDRDGTNSPKMEQVAVLATRLNLDTHPTFQSSITALPLASPGVSSNVSTRKGVAADPVRTLTPITPVSKHKQVPELLDEHRPSGAMGTALAALAALDSPTNLGIMPDPSQQATTNDMIVDVPVSHVEKRALISALEAPNPVRAPGESSPKDGDLGLGSVNENMFLCLQGLVRSPKLCGFDRFTLIF